MAPFSRSRFKPFSRDIPASCCWCKTNYATSIQKAPKHASQAFAIETVKEGHMAKVSAAPRLAFNPFHFCIVCTRSPLMHEPASKLYKNLSQHMQIRQHQPTNDPVHKNSQATRHPSLLSFQGTNSPITQYTKKVTHNKWSKHAHCWKPINPPTQIQAKSWQTTLSQHLCTNGKRDSSAPQDASAIWALLQAEMCLPKRKGQLMLQKPID